MPIGVDEFDAFSEETLDIGEGTNAYRVLRFLASDSDKAFVQKEIQEGADVKAGSVGPVLKRLEDRSLVRHKGKYWTIGDDDRLGALAGTWHTAQAIEDRFPDEDMDAWAEYAEDPYEDE